MFSIVKKLFYIFSFIFIIHGCSEKYEGNISYTQELELGFKLDSILISNQQVLDDTVLYKAVFSFVDSIFQKISKTHYLVLNIKMYTYCIINDNKCNAFILPGNYLYFTTGLLKRLDNTAQFASLVYHFIIHNDRRHQTDNLEKFYGINTLLNTLKGDENVLNRIVEDIFNNSPEIAFSIEQEKETLRIMAYLINETGYEIN